MSDSQIDEPPVIVPMSTNDVIGVFMLGGLVGLICWVLGILLHHYVFDAYLCQGDITSQCGVAKDYAAVVAGLVGAGVALGGLMRLRIYRPLLVVLASMFSLWGALQMVWGLLWYQGLLVAVILYALAYVTFSWMARIRPFWVALATLVILVVVIRAVLVL